jgi:NADPH-dependent glutamate synthase beta subunit-like oxidoreductase/NAD(P)H-flavin reductase
MELNLAHNLHFSDLYYNDGLKKIDNLFLNYLKSSNVDLYKEHINIREDNGASVDKKTYSNHIIDVSVYLDEFIADLFNINTENRALIETINPLSIITQCKRLFVQRYALRKYSSCVDIEKIKDAFNFDNELNFARLAIECLEENDESKLDLLSRYTAWAVFSEEGRERHKDGILFQIPRKIIFDKLVDYNIEDEIEVASIIKRKREGFKLTDHGCNNNYAFDQASYCIHCHKQEKDSCSTGLKEKEGGFKLSEGNVPLTGCPLEEKISEMNSVYAQGYSIAALSIITIDNPMLAATGHRICNDCMKSCIYQKQEPVNIPQIESRILKNILELPFGFEIYSLLTRWNPIRTYSVLPKEDSGYKVLVVGQGPSGFTLAHYLLNAGHKVVAIDGLKIEPLNIEFKPIYKIAEYFKPLDERVIDGFGGVMEYGITSRWDKNNLKIIRLLLERRSNYLLMGGVRFGSNINYEQAKELGFDHIALCVGAGKPNLLDIKNTLAKGIRTSSDFLMSLQLTGAAQVSSIASLQIRLPILVIGGGLTAIDTATEALAYYPVQVEKFLSKYENLEHNITANFRSHKTRGEEHAATMSCPEIDLGLNLTDEEKVIANEFIKHAKLLREERKKENPDIAGLLFKWGGVKVLYRKGIKDSPAYRLNHEEIELALQEGIKFIDYVEPKEIVLDQYNNVDYIVADRLGQNIDFQAKTVLLAIGTNPNTVIADELPDIFKLDKKYLVLRDHNGVRVVAETTAKPKEDYFLHYLNHDLSVTIFGDMHPSYKGNVVKAMASAKNGFKFINNLLANKAINNCDNQFFKRVIEQLTSVVYQVNSLADNIVEVIIESPLAVANFKPGQFYRLQNYISNAFEKDSTKLAMESVALTGAYVDKEKGLLSLIVLEMGGSSNLCRSLKPGEKVALMGPTGAPTEIKPNENILLLGGGLGNAVLFSIGKAFRECNSKVLYFAAYRKATDRFKAQDIEAAADKIIWCCEEDISINREGDISFQGNIVEALKWYAKNYPNALNKIDRIIAIGSDGMMSAINQARTTSLDGVFKASCEVIASINSPMQCAMKEICSQCIQKHVDVDTGIETYVYSCVNQDQKMDIVDFDFLNIRLKQNSLQEKITAQWLKFFHIESRR